MAATSTHVLAAVLVGILIVVALVSFAYVENSSNLSALSTQNTNLQQQVGGLGQQISGLSLAASSLIQQVSTLEQKTLTVLTETNTIFSVETTTATTTLTSVSTSLQTTTSVTTHTTVSTSTVYPVPDNVTILFTKVSGGYSYSITAGSSTYSGSSGGQLSIPINPVFQGETIGISTSETGTFGCSNGQTVTAQVYLNGAVVAQGTQTCGGSNIALSYTV
jgi:hypothetical protein